MGVKLKRAKPKQIWLSVMYRLSKIPFAPSTTKMKLFLNLEWIFHRLAHENSYAIYTEDSHPIRVKTKEFLLQLINKSDSVLDLGCNLGVMSNYLADKAKKVVGIDYNKKAIDTAKKNYSKPNLEFHAVEAIEYLNSTEENFEVLILSHILEHLEEPEEFLNKFKDYFQNIYIEVPDFERYYMNLYRKDLNLKLKYSDDDHISEFDREELTEIITNCGLEIKQTEYRYGVQKYWCYNPCHKGQHN